MAEKNDAEVAQLKKIQRELADIRLNTGSSGWFWRGVLQGAGALIGSAAALLALSWVLSVVGIIPGLNEIAAYLGTVFSNLRH